MLDGKVLVTGSSGHLGEALVRVLRDNGSDVVGLDVLGSPFTTVTGSVSDRGTVRSALAGVSTVFHVATLHKPHVGSHGRPAFVDTNVMGTLILLEEAVAAGVESFVFTSTTSTFGRALNPPPGEPAAWITESVVPAPRNIYGVTKTAAEDLCEIIHRDNGLPVVVLRVARFFPEPDDREPIRAAYPDANVKVNEYLYRRVDIADVVDAHLLAAGRGTRLVSRSTLSRPRRRLAWTIWLSCVPTRRAWSGGCFRTPRRSTNGGAGACFPASSACTSTRRRARN